YENAVNTAWENNPDVRSAQLNAQYYEALKGSWKDIAKTDFNIELGQFNSYQFDNKLAIYQGFAAPGVYKSQRRVLTENHLAAEAGTQDTRRRLRTEVGLLYYEYLFLLEKQRELQRADSIFGLFEERAALRFRQGEQNVLELNSAQLQHRQTSQQLFLLQRDAERVLWQFNTLLNAGTVYVPAPESPSLPAGLLTPADTARLSFLPSLEIRRRQLAAAQWQKELEKARNRPEFTVGITNQSVIGYQVVNNQDRFFDGSHRFWYLGGGISAPLFTKAQRARVAAWDVEIRKQQNDLAWAQKQVASEFEVARRAVVTARESLDFYEKQALPASRSIIQAADAQLAAGEIDYLQWTALIRQSLETSQQYLETKNNYHQAVIRLQQFDRQ
ncbi:MAG: TolC family protein, partial [Bacteroidota bacterium]